MTAEDTDSSGSDYEVEHYVRPDKIRKQVNDDSADLLGNFDDEKRKEIFEGKYDETKDNKNPSDGENDDEEVKDFSGGESGNEAKTNNASDDDEDDEEMEDEKDEEPTTKLTSEQLASLMRGASKANRFVLYVTNLNFDTVKEDLEDYFSQAGEVKSVRIPKKRRGGFAFVEMANIDGFQRAFALHNTDLQGRKIKVQISEAGKKKSANKKNIMKQKNRKLAEMRSEQKFFTKSGKYYDKTLKKEKAKELLARKKWRRKPGPKPT
ncbi:uncharacterized protein LOC129921413 [Episyrphus balteatus]|uniref:uncharacterized protein LOC129921413 n=1 Tax=Episyrphus balteatus TaxID=286459 RepID=UPI002486AD58|nr:uncharacterized protein LOC129921413 [Episyrphus balteatus]